MGFEGYGSSARALPPNAVRLATTEKHTTAIAAITRGILVLPGLFVSEVEHFAVQDIATSLRVRPESLSRIA
jgi:hypothetical protein